MYVTKTFLYLLKVRNRNIFEQRSLLPRLRHPTPHQVATAAAVEPNGMSGRTSPPVVFRKRRSQSRQIYGGYRLISRFSSRSDRREEGAARREEKQEVKKER